MVSPWNAPFNRARQYLIEDDFEACRDAAGALLKEPDLPVYFQIRSMMLIAQSTTDWEKAEVCIHYT